MGCNQNHYNHSEICWATVGITAVFNHLSFFKQVVVELARSIGLGLATMGHIEVSFYDTGMLKLPHWLEKIIKCNGDYVQK